MNEIKFRLVISGWDDVKLIFNADEYEQATSLLKTIKEHIVCNEERSKRIYLEAVTEEDLAEEEERNRKLQETLRKDQGKENEE